MKMNSAQGKQILALVREGNYAHPGEEQAIELALAPYPRNWERRILDLGCGLGGTAEYVRRNGWGSVTGVDIDGETLAAAARVYKEIDFVTADAGSLGEIWQEKFDLIYLFNSFYAFPDQPGALRQMSRVARPGASLVIFEYTDLDGSFQEQVAKESSWWTPINLTSFPEQLKAAGWQLDRVYDITEQYLLWYRELCGRIESKKAEIVGRFGIDWYDFTHATYFALLSLVERKVVGGAIIRARRSEPAS
jgi:ubiquinone/menaquinone biosynthesis C-methylase UbiE